MNKTTIEGLAEDAIPLYPIYADVLNSLNWETYIRHLRMQWVEGYKAALQLKEGLADREIYVPVSVEEELPKTEGGYIIDGMYEILSEASFRNGHWFEGDVCVEEYVKKWLKKTTLSELGVLPISEKENLVTSDNKSSNSSGER